MTVIFDGNKFASVSDELKKKVYWLKKKGVTPKLVALQVGESKESKVYLSKKKKAAEKIGVKLEVSNQRLEVGEEIIREIEKLNQDESVHGIMIQLPLPKNLRLRTKNLIQKIVPEKDVDGMRSCLPAGRDDSLFVAPVVRAVLSAIKEAGGMLSAAKLSKVVVVGAKGFVGRKICKVLRKMGCEVEGVDIETKNLKLKTKNADVLISATGSPNLIKKGMVKTGSVVIDVGYPQGDVERKAYEKASFVSPVPGGVGPVTIACLLENLIEAAASSVS